MLPISDHVHTAAQAWAAAVAVQRRRAAGYERITMAKLLHEPIAPIVVSALPPPPPPLPVAPLPQVLVPAWQEIRDEVARQAGVDREVLYRDGGRKLAIVALRHLAVALTRRLTTLSFPAIARRYGLRDHTSAWHATLRMRPLTNALDRELTDADPPGRWVERSLLLLKDRNDLMRARYRAKACRTEGRHDHSSTAAGQIPAGVEDSCQNWHSQQRKL